MNSQGLICFGDGRGSENCKTKFEETVLWMKKRKKRSLKIRIDGVIMIVGFLINMNLVYLIVCAYWEEVVRSIITLPPTIHVACVCKYVMFFLITHMEHC